MFTSKFICICIWIRCKVNRFPQFFSFP